MFWCPKHILGVSQPDSWGVPLKFKTDKNKVFYRKKTYCLDIWQIFSEKNNKDTTIMIGMGNLSDRHLWINKYM